MIRQVIVILVLCSIVVCGLNPLNSFAANDTLPWKPLLDVAFEKNDLEMAVVILVNDNNIPVSDIILKARDIKYRDTQIVDALLDTKLSSGQVIIAALQNNVPPEALFNSKKIRDDYGYTPDSILRFLVEELRFLNAEQETLGQKKENAEIKLKNINIIFKVCKSMLEDKDYTKFEIISNLCLSEASKETVNLVSERFTVPPATTLKACVGHAVYGQSYISRQEFPQKAYIVIGVDHLTIDDDAGRDVISPMRP